MSMYLSRLFPRSNSSFLLCSGNALKAEVLRIRDQMLLVDAGIGRPRFCMQDETTVTGMAINRFENKVGYLNNGVGSGGGGESLMKKRILERFFVDVVGGDSLIRERAAARFNDLVGSGSLDVVAGEPTLLNPRRFRQNLAWLELNKLWRTNSKVKGFFIEKVRGGYSVAIAGKNKQGSAIANADIHSLANQLLVIVSLFNDLACIIHRSKPIPVHLTL